MDINLLYILMMLKQKECTYECLPAFLRQILNLISSYFLSSTLLVQAVLELQSGRKYLKNEFKFMKQKTIVGCEIDLAVTHTVSSRKETR